MFRANFCPSSEAQDLDFLQHMVQYPVMWYAGVSERVVWHYVYVSSWSSIFTLPTYIYVHNFIQKDFKF
jgi:hypothetical protein